MYKYAEVKTAIRYIGKGYSVRVKIAHLLVFYCIRYVY